MSPAASGVTAGPFLSSLPHSASELQVESIQSPVRLAELEPSWRALWLSLSDGTPFQSPDWLLPWCNSYCRDPLFSFAYWKNGTLVGIALLFIYRDQRQCRKLLLLGTGNTDYLDVVFHPQFRKECWQLLICEIQNRHALWDECHLQRLRAESPVLEGIALEKQFLSKIYPQEPCPVLDLRRVGRASSMLKKANYYAAKLRRQHPFSIEEATNASLDESLEALQRLHCDRWRQKGMPGVLTTENDHAFHWEAARRLFNAQMLKLYCLRINDQIAATLYGFRHASRTYFYLSGFDPKYARMSMGTVLLGHVIERAINENGDAFDFLTGREPYKYRWGAADRPIFGRTISKKR